MSRISIITVNMSRIELQRIVQDLTIQDQNVLLINLLMRSILMKDSASLLTFINSLKLNFQKLKSELYGE